jgi:hypothetical protein
MFRPVWTVDVTLTLVRPSNDRCASLSTSPQTSICGCPSRPTGTLEVKTKDVMTSNGKDRAPFFELTQSVRRAQTPRTCIFVTITRMNQVRPAIVGAR